MTVTCDKCERDITWRGPMPQEWRIKIDQESLQRENPGETAEWAIMCYPPMNQACYFCSKCWHNLVTVLAEQGWWPNATS